MGNRPASFLADWIERISSRTMPSSRNSSVIFVSSSTTSPSFSTFFTFTSSATIERYSSACFERLRHDRARIGHHGNDVVFAAEEFRENAFLLYFWPLFKMHALRIVFLFHCLVQIFCEERHRGRHDCRERVEK